MVNMQVRTTPSTILSRQLLLQTNFLFPHLLQQSLCHCVDSLMPFAHWEDNCKQVEGGQIYINFLMLPFLIALIIQFY